VPERKLSKVVISSEAKKSYDNKNRNWKFGLDAFVLFFPISTF
jgi:hypothetical protein